MLHARPLDFAWKLTQHICAGCLGRVLERVLADGHREFRCSNCDVTAIAPACAAHPPICACAMRVGKRDAGVRCRPNTRCRPALPSEIVAGEAA